MRRPNLSLREAEKSVDKGLKMVRGEVKTAKINGCCRVTFAFLHALKIGIFRWKWTSEWVFKTLHLLHPAIYFLMNSKLGFPLHVSQRCLVATAKNVWFRAQNSAKNNLLPLSSETSLAWKFLFLRSFFKNYLWIFENIFVFQQAMSIKSLVQVKLSVGHGETLTKCYNETTAVAQKKYG